MAKINLPGNFNSFPKGPKPPSYAGRAQRTVSAAASAVKAAQRTIENGFSRVVHATPALTPPGWSEARSPKPAASTPKKRTPVTTLGGYKAQSSTDGDPYGNYYFSLEIGGAEIAHFMECSGLKNASQVFEIQEGGLNGNVHKRPGQSKWENIILKYATSASTELLAWRDSFLQDNFPERLTHKNNQGSIALMSNDGKVVRRYTFTHAWPVSWEGPSMSAGGSDLAVETLEIAHDGLKIEGP